jgi:peptide/nickel transport system substrate-binding protein
MVQALRSGQIDVIDAVPPAEYGLLKNDAHVKVVEGKPIAIQEMGMNSWVPQPGQTRANPKEGSKGNPWLTKVSVRQALMYAVPKQQIVRTALLGYAVPAQSIVPPTFPCSWQPSGYQTIGYSPTTTKSRLEALGFKDTDGDGYLNVPTTARSFDPKGAGKDFTLRLYIRKNQPADLTAGQLIQQSMKRAGVKITLLVVDESPFLADATFPSATNADTDLYIWGWGGVFSPDPAVEVGRIGLTSQINGWQDANYSNPQFDALYAKQYSDVDQASRCGIEKQMQQMFYDKGAYSALWYPDRLQAYRSDRWTGFRMHDGAIFSALSYGPYNTLLDVTPTSTSTSTAFPTGVIITTAVVIALLAIALAFIYRYRRRAVAEEAEDA